MRILTPLACLLAAVSALPAHAASYDYSFNINSFFQGAQLPGFDNSLGTLNSVNVNLGASHTEYYTSPNSYGGTFVQPGGTWTATVNFYSPDFLQTLSSSATGTLTPGTLLSTTDGVSEYQYSMSANGSTLFSNPDDIAIFSSNTSLIAQGVGKPSTPRPVTSPGDRGNQDLQALIKLTFNYTPTGAVPEPGTWGLMIVGVGMAGVGLRARRKREQRLVAANA